MKVITFGEIMLRLATPQHLRFEQATEFEATYGGGEANVAVSLANYGVEAAFVSKVPSHAIGQCAVNELRRYGVDTSFMARGGERLGTYYLESGASQRASQVIYDRAASAIALASEEDFDWKSIFQDATWFHFTGITPALSDTLAAITLQACTYAKEHNITVSCDLNYRKKLWSPEKAKEVMSKIMPFVDVCIGNEEDAQKVFGIQAANTDVEKGHVDHASYVDVAKQLQERFNLSLVAITLRESISATNNKWAAMLYDGQAHFSKKYDLHIIDRVGGGDSFAGGLIYALLQKYNHQDAIEFAVAASALKHSIQGDFNRVSVEEVNTLMQGDGSGRVQR